MRKWEEEGYEHRRTIGYEEKYAELGGEAASRNADLAMTARERKQRRIEAAAARAGLGEDEEDEREDVPPSKRAGSRPQSQPEQQQHDIRTWEFELVTPEDEASTARRGGGAASRSKRAGGAGGASGGGRPARGGKFQVGGANDPDLMSD